MLSVTYSNFCSSEFPFSLLCICLFVRCKIWKFDKFDLKRKILMVVTWWAETVLARQQWTPLVNLP